MKMFPKIIGMVAVAVLCGMPGSAEAQEAKKPAAGASAESKVKNVTAEEFDKLRKAKNTVVLDVRTEEEYKEGHIPGSIRIDFNSEDFEKEVAKLDKDKVYLVHCAAGGRSTRACKKMEALKFKNLYNLQGGLGAWEKAGKPVEK